MRDALCLREIPCRSWSVSARFVTAASSRAQTTTFLVHAPPPAIPKSRGSTGKATFPAASPESGGYRGVALSPDGSRAVASRTDPQDASKADLWLFDLSRGTGGTRLTLGTGIAEMPIWSPDGKRIAFTFSNNMLRQKLASGEGRAGVDAGGHSRLHSARRLVAGRTVRSLCVSDVVERNLGSLCAAEQRFQTCPVRADRIHRGRRAGFHRTVDGWPTSRMSRG